MHDPRVGRFFAIDPLAAKYPHNSPYAFSENRLLDGVELEGLEWQGMKEGNTTSQGSSTSMFKPSPSYKNKSTIQKAGEFAAGMQQGGRDVVNSTVSSAKEAITNPSSVPIGMFNAVSMLNARVSNLLGVPNTQDILYGTNYAEQDKAAMVESGNQLLKATESPFEAGRLTGSTIVESGMIVGGVFLGESNLFPKFSVIRAANITKFDVDIPSSFKGGESGSVDSFLKSNGWNPAPTSSNKVNTGGTKYSNDVKGEAVRIMPGAANRSEPLKRGPYMIISKGGTKTTVPLKGNPTL